MHQLLKIMSSWGQDIWAEIKDHVYRMVKVEGRCTQLTLSSLHTYIIIGWHKSIVSSDWSDAMVWFGQILLYLYFYHPIYMILDFYLKSRFMMKKTVMFARKVTRLILMLMQSDSRVSADSPGLRMSSRLEDSDIGSWRAEN